MSDGEKFDSILSYITKSGYVQKFQFVDDGKYDSIADEGSELLAKNLKALDKDVLKKLIILGSERTYAYSDISDSIYNNTQKVSSLSTVRHVIGKASDFAVKKDTANVIKTIFILDYAVGGSSIKSFDPTTQIAVIQYEAGTGSSVDNRHYLISDKKITPLKNVIDILNKSELEKVTAAAKRELKEFGGIYYNSVNVTKSGNVYQVEVSAYHGPDEVYHNGSGRIRYLTSDFKTVKPNTLKIEDLSKTQ
ncbi:hypothetical protein [Flavobacterium sp.]|uniref:hypothetical protein n=1 Tax=Flavobacterium sp. TaxID=239 RepID=UPI0025BF6B47|nr:hypothetical protein [Flavobacterium sp.]